VQGSVIWQRLRKFAIPWVQSYRERVTERDLSGDFDVRMTDGLHALVSDLWLEFDSSEAGGIPEPSVFIGIDEQLQQLVHELNPASGSPLHDLAQGGSSPEEIHRVLSGLLSSPFSMLPKPMSPAVASHLAWVVMNIPSTMPIYQVGLWLTRDPTKVRLVIENDGTDPRPGAWIVPMIDFLRSIRWPGDLVRLQALLHKLSLVANEGVYLAVDVGEVTGPKLGLESYVGTLESLSKIREHQLQWVSFLQWLEQEGWCTKEKAAAHQEYIGVGNKTDDDGIMKVTLDGTPRGSTTMVRKINHIKLVLEGPDIPSEVKLYTWVPLTRTRAWKKPKPPPPPPDEMDGDHDEEGENNLEEEGNHEEEDKGGEAYEGPMEGATETEGYEKEKIPTEDEL